MPSSSSNHLQLSPEAPEAPRRRRHLVVLQHGLGGTATNMLSLWRSIAASLPELQHDFMLLNITSNEGLARSKEGIRVCGERLFRDILDELLPGGVFDTREALAYTDISIIGYSAGGLFGRYAVGLLEESGVLDALHCASFITLATPHLGSIRPSDGTWRTALWNQGGGTLDKMTKPLRPRWMDGGAIVDQLFLRDAVSPWFECSGRAEPALLESMAEPHSSYIRGLGRFTRLITVANARADRTVPCETAAILPMNPFDGVEEVTPISEDFPHVARVMEPGEATPLIEECTRDKRRYYESFSDPEVMQRMVDGLSTLHWQRVFAWLPGGHTHGTVIARQWSDSPEQERQASNSCGQDVVAFTSSVVRASVLVSSS